MKRVVDLNILNKKFNVVFLVYVRSSPSHIDLLLPVGVQLCVGLVHLELDILVDAGQLVHLPRAPTHHIM